LRHFVVLAAAKTRGDLPDIAVGFALANHLAKAYGHASFVVVPRYLEANARLEQQLRNEHQLVTGGVVLGQTGIISDDTRALLRQIITATNPQGTLAQIKGSLGDLGIALAALFALIGVLTAARVAPALIGGGAGWIRDVLPIFPPLERRENMGPETEEPRRSVIPGRGRRTGAEAVSEGRKPFLLRQIGEPEVTVWLRSGWRITGKLRPDDDQSNDSGSASEYVVEVTAPRLRREGDEDREADRVRLRLADIELISIGDREVERTGGTGD
jgi:hypothetical protein